MKTKAFKWASSIAVALVVVLAVMVVPVTVLALDEPTAREIYDIKLIDSNGCEFEGSVQFISESATGDYGETLKAADYGTDVVELLTDEGFNGDLSDLNGYVFYTGFWVYQFDDSYSQDDIDAIEYPITCEISTLSGATLSEAGADSNMCFLFIDVENSEFGYCISDAYITEDGVITIDSGDWTPDFPAVLLITETAFEELPSSSTTYNITYDYNDGTSATKVDTSQVTQSGEYADVLGIGSYTRDGYVFVNWNTLADGTGTSYVAGNSIQLTDNVTLYAQWEECILGVSSDSSGTMTVPGEVITSSKGDGVIYVKVTSEYLDKYDTSAYPTTSLTRTDYTSPDSGSYIFAGWYSSVDTDDDANSVAMTAVPTSSNSYAYAKFVDANVLSVKAQIRKGTDGDSDDSDIRFVSTVDSKYYKQVGFLITINGTTLDKDSTTVYEKIVVSSSDNTELYTDPSDFSSVSKYFFTYAVLEVPKTNFSTGITVQPYWITLDGTTVKGTAVTKTVQQGIDALSGS